jgi:hypothetical protein
MFSADSDFWRWTAAIYEDEALLAMKALNASSLNILAQK